MGILTHYGVAHHKEYITRAWKYGGRAIYMKNSNRLSKVSQRKINIGYSRGSAFYPRFNVQIVIATTSLYILKLAGQYGSPALNIIQDPVKIRIRGGPQLCIQ